MILFSKNFYCFSAVCAVASGLTTFLLWVLPFAYNSADGQNALPTINFYPARLWVNFFHIFLALFAYWAAAAAKKLQPNAVFISLGLISFLIWGITESLGVTILLFAVNFNWRANLVAASNQNVITIFKSNISLYDIWDAMFFLLLTAFLCGSLFYGIALIKGRGFEKTVGICFLLAVPLTIFIIVGDYTSITFFDSLVLYIYPSVQAISRILLGVYL